MPIPLPNLDDRRWADLADEGRAQITRYAPQWTDHNLHDPGITLIDLYAWLAEMTAYRLNRISPRHRRKFVQLLGFPPLDPSPSSVMLSFSPVAATPVFVIPAGAEFEGTNVDLQVVPFRTLSDVTVSPTFLKAVQVESGGSFLDRTADFSEGFPIQPFGGAPVPGDALYLGFDPLQASTPLSIGVRLAGPGNDAAERERILEEGREQAAACQPVRTRLRCVPDLMTPPVPLPPHHSVKLVWEAFTSAGWIPLSPVDDTRSLTLDGFVELPIPANIALSQQGAVITQFFYLRCRLSEGAYDAVPIVVDIAINAARAEQAVPATQTFKIKRGVAPVGPAPAPGALTGIAFALDSIGVITSSDFTSNTGPSVRVWSYTAPTAGSDGEITLGLRVAGIGSVLPDQLIELLGAPVTAADIWTLSGSTWLQWTRRDDFDAATRVDPIFVLDPTLGQVQFGSGERGRSPEPGALIVAIYKQTTAESGNVAPGTVNRLRQSPVNDLLLAGIPPATRAQLPQMVTNRGAAADGAPAEELDHAEGRAVERLHAHERLLDLAQQAKALTLDEIDRDSVRQLLAPTRGVNLLDLERIALSVPGTRIARARAWASLHPHYPCFDAPGVVTIVIIPDAPVHKPQPSAGLIDAVWRYMNRRRMLTTMLNVAGPQYVEVTVSASVQLLTGASPSKVSARISAALNAFLDPLGGGPDSLGWPFGRSVFRTEILQLIDSLPGVDHVVSMTMVADSGPQQCGDIPLCPMALVTSGQHNIEVL